MYLAYKGYSVLVISPILAFALAILGSGGTLPGMVALTEVFMAGLTGFLKAYFLIILVGAIFGKIMGASGASASLAEFISSKFGAKNTILSIVVTSAILVYGGISIFVVVFAIYPIAVALLKEVDIPKRLLPAAICLGASTFAMTALPGTPQAVNAIPSAYLGTSLYSAPVIGILSSIIMFALGMLYLNKQVRKAKVAGEGFGDHKKDIIGEYTGEKPPVWLSAVPLLVIPVIALTLEKIYYPVAKDAYLPAMEAVTGKAAINPLWPILIAIISATVIAFIIFFKYAKKPKEVLKEGAEESLLPSLNTASQVGYGTVVGALPAFAAFQGTLAAMSAPVLVKIAASTTLLAGIVGSASGGTAIAFAAMGDTLIELANANGISLEVVHRVSLIAAGGLDSLPHSGAVITLLAVSSLTHKESYKDIAVCTVVIPLIATVFAILFAMMGLV